LGYSPLFAIYSCVYLLLHWVAISLILISCKVGSWLLYIGFDSLENIPILAFYALRVQLTIICAIYESFSLFSFRYVEPVIVFFVKLMRRFSIRIWRILNSFSIEILKNYFWINHTSPFGKYFSIIKYDLHELHSHIKWIFTALCRFMPK
jgi:hypothetical protein